MFMQSGIPVLYSGDEIGQLNDYSYKEDPNKATDSRYLHRDAMRWDLAEKIQEKGSMQDKLYHGLSALEKLRKSEKAFVATADMWTVETFALSVLCIGRYYDGDKMYGVFNFSEEDKTAWIDDRDGIYVELLTGEERMLSSVNVPAYGFFWFKKK